MNKLSKDYIPYLTSLSALWILLWIIYYYTPFVIDDEHFRNFLAPYFANPGIATFFESWRDSFMYRFFVDNGRIFNLIATPILIIPKWILAGLLSGCSVVNIYLVAKTSDTWLKSFALFSGIIFLYVFTLPWVDHMFTTMFSLNYITASIPSLIVLYVFLKERRLGIAAGAGLGFLAAWCHEGIAGPTALGLLLCMLFYRRFRSRTAMLILTGMAVGVLYLLFLVPGTRVRTSNAVFSFGVFNFFNFLHHALPVFIMLCLTACAMCVKSWRSKINKPALLTIYGTCAGAFVVWLLWMTGARLTWYLDLAAILGIAILLTPIAGCVPKWLDRVASALALTAVFAHLGACIPYAKAFMQEYNTIRRLDAESTTGEVFYDTLEPWDAPQYLLGKVNYNGLHEWTYSTRRTIPTALKDFRPENAAEGYCNMSKAYVVDNMHVVIEDYPERDDDDVLDFIVNDRQTYALGFLTPFTGADGKRYFYCRPGVISLRAKWENVSGVIIIPPAKNEVDKQG